MPDRELVISRNSDDDHLPSVSDELGRQLDGLVGPGGFENDIDASAERGYHDSLTSIESGGVDRYSAEPLNHTQAPWQLLDHKERIQSRGAGNLEDQQSDRSGADNRGRIARCGFRQIDSMQRNSKRLEHRAGLAIKSFRKR